MPAPRTPTDERGTGRADEVRASLTALCRALLDEVDDLADRLTARIVDREDVYERLDVAVDDDVRATCRANIERTLLVLAGDLPADVEAGRVTVETGIRRARQGVPLEVVLRAYRMCGRMLWEGMRVVSARRFDGAHDAALLGAADAVWRIIDTSSDLLVDAYRSEEAHARDRERERRYALVEDLLAGRDVDPGSFRHAAATLDVPEHGPLVCAVAPLGTADALHRPRETLLDAGFPSLWHTRFTEVVGLVPLPSTGPTAPGSPAGRLPATLVDALERCARAPVGVSSPVEGLTAVATAHRWARLALSTLAPGVPRVAGLDDRLPEALLLASPELAGRLRATALGAVLDLPDTERRPLLETLSAVLDADGSPTRAARRLYCHRNTVMYRLRRIESLTGRRVADPRDRLGLGLALLATDASPP